MDVDMTEGNLSILVLILTHSCILLHPLITIKWQALITYESTLRESNHHQSNLLHLQKLLIGFS